MRAGLYICFAVLILAGCAPTPKVTADTSDGRIQSDRILYDSNCPDPDTDDWEGLLPLRPSPAEATIEKLWAFVAVLQDDKTEDLKRSERDRRRREDDRACIRTWKRAIDEREDRE